MRSELKQEYKYEYDLSLCDFGYTINVVLSLIKDVEIITEMQVNDIIGNEPLQEKNPFDPRPELISDKQYYSYLRTNYLWHYAIWKLQGIFEGLITKKYIETKKLKLKEKIKYLKSKGYVFNQDDLNELYDWAKLRNMLSHLPCEQYRPVQIYESDVMEYKDLLIKISNVFIT